MSQIDFDQLVNSPQYQVSISTSETPQEMQNRLLLEKWQFLAMLLAVFGGAIFCIIVYFYHPSPDDKRWALNILQAIFTGGVFYGIGQKAAR